MVVAAGLCGGDERLKVTKQVHLTYALFFFNGAVASGAQEYLDLHIASRTERRLPRSSGPSNPPVYDKARHRAAHGFFVGKLQLHQPRDNALRVGVDKSLHLDAAIRSNPVRNHAHANCETRRSAIPANRGIEGDLNRRRRFAILKPDGGWYRRHGRHVRPASFAAQLDRRLRFSRVTCCRAARKSRSR